MNTNITIARGPCPRCGKPDVPMRNNFTLFEHRHAGRPGFQCMGPGPEIMLTCLLRRFRLDGRPDADGMLMEDDRDWSLKQSRLDAEATQRLCRQEAQR